MGSVGLYLAAGPRGGRELLVQRRSKLVYEKLTIATPGGIVDVKHCGEDGTDFNAGARFTALKELKEESGIDLDPNISMSLMPVARVCKV